MAVDSTSLRAYTDILPELGERQLAVYNALLNMGEATNTMVANHLGLPINCITGRMHELRNQKKLVGFAFIKPCKITGKNSRYWKVVKRI